MHKQKIISFSDIVEKTKKDSKQKVSSVDNRSKEEVRQMVKEAKEKGILQIQEFEKMTNDYLQAVKKLSLFSGAYADTIEGISSMTCDQLIKPIVLGEEIQGMSEKLYMAFRKQVYDDLFIE